MPQDSLRSIVYRSFVRCDDPNGVVECGTIRKSKTGSRKTEHRFDGRRTRKDSNPSSVCKEGEVVVSKGIREELHTPSTFQLLEVSRGAQKLNQMIDTWSKGPSFDGQSKDIARDLLKGALDLQESLVMLCKLQEASKFMAQLKQKQKPKSEQGLDVEVERIHSDRFGEKDYQKGLRNPRLSVDGSSSNCIEELKKVIKESLARQNLLPITSPEEKASLGQSTFDTISDIPSTSSSQSSMVYNNFGSADCSVSSMAQQKKAKAPSVIAKLMGLEELPAEPIQIPPKQSENENNLNQRRPIVDIEMPKTRKPYFVDRNANPERRTLKDIIEAMQFKGLLKSNHDEGPKLQSHLSNTSHSKKRLDDKMPPIVIIKPWRFQYQETEGTLLGQFSSEEEALYPKEKLKELQAREEPPNKRFVQVEGALEPKVMLRKLDATEEPPTKTSNQDKEALNPKGMPGKVEVKEQPPTKRFIREDGALESKVILRKHEVKNSETMEKASPSKMKTSVPLNHKTQKKEETNKKADKMQKASPNRRKPVEKENAKSVTVSRYQDQVRATSTQSRKPENGSIIVKNHVRRQESTTKNPNSTRSIQPISKNPINRTKKKPTRKAKPVKESLEITSVTDNLQCKDGDKEMDQTYKMDSVSTTTSTSIADQLLTEKGMEAPNLKIEDHSDDDQSSLCEVTAQISQHGSGDESAEESKQHVDHKTTFEKTTKTEINLKGLLLSSPSFLSCAEDFFDLNMNQPIVLQTTGISDVEMINTRFILDCAKELMEQKSLRTSQVVHPLLRTRVVDPRIDISLDQLVEEVCDGIENLRSYGKVEDDVLLIHILCNMLESDLKGKGVMVSGVWDLGWMNEFSVGEADQVVGEVEKQVFNGLIEEVITDLVC